MLRGQMIRALERQSRRLLIVLHGLGDSMEGYRWLPSALGLPWLNYLLIDAPDPYYGGYSWYDFAGDPAPGIQRSRQMLFELLEREQAAGHPAEAISLFGFSQGCLMTIEVGLRYPQRLAGLVGVSGYVHEPEQLLSTLSPVAKEQRVLLTHGTQDPLLSCAEVRKQAARLKAAGLQVEWHEFQKVHTIADEEEIDLIRNFLTQCYA